MSEKEKKGGLKPSQLFEKNRMAEYFKGDKGRRLLIILGIAGVALIFLSTFVSPGHDKKQQTEIKNIDCSEYEAQLEQRLVGIVSEIDGVGTAKVMVTLENGVKYIYASDSSYETQTQQNGSDKADESCREETNIVIVDSADGRRALVTTEIQPQVKGVIVVCDGAQSATVRQSVTEAVTTVLGISSRKVCVVCAG